jgi:site-specific DNA-cytosine methylase
MNVLVACEYSGIVRDAFLDAGHYAMSCDILPSESERTHPLGDHWHGDVMNCLYHTGDWDLIIMHPPCTHLCVSGNRWYGKGQPGHDKRIEAVEWTALLWNLACQKSLHVVLENPVGVLSSLWRPPEQYVQPHQFGHPEFKKTGLWLTPGLPKLKPTNQLVVPESNSSQYHEWMRVWRMAPGPERGKERSRFFTGIAAAMAEQWSW